MIRIFFVAVISLFAIGCVSNPYESRLEDVKSVRFVRFGNYPLGAGYVYVLSPNRKIGAVPDDKDAAAIQVTEARFREFGYEITNNPNNSDFVVMLDWKVENVGRIGSPYNSLPAIVHTVSLAFFDNRTTEKEKMLWFASNAETWGHTKIEPSRMISLALQKFPN